MKLMIGLYHNDRSLDGVLYLVLNDDRVGYAEKVVTISVRRRRLIVDSMSLKYRAVQYSTVL